VHEMLSSEELILGVVADLHSLLNSCQVRVAACDVCVAACGVCVEFEAFESLVAVAHVT